MSDRFVESSENRKNTYKDSNNFYDWFLTEYLAYKGIHFASDFSLNENFETDVCAQIG